ncbi:ATP-dependent helicase [bacterium]|nr:ATP-dependent helicase [bacterium]
MLLEGSLASDKTNILIQKYADLLNSGIPASNILVIVPNSNLKNIFIAKTLEKLTINAIEKMEVHSFFSLVYNTINDNWAVLENANPYKGAEILPNLAGLEVSQFLLKDIIKEVQFKGYNSKKSLLHQLFRRYSLIVQNNLTDDDIEWRSRILGESFAPDAKLALKKLIAKTLELRDFDYLRQGLVFNYIYKNTDYFKNIEYLILDDGDEITPICFDFIKHLANQLKDVFIAFDSKGASRTGYLSADKTAVWEFEKLFNQTIISIDSNTELRYDAENIFNNAIGNSQNILKNFSIQSPSKRAKMIDIAINQINSLLEKKIKPNEIAIVTPLVDDMLKFSLKESLKSNVNIQFLSGNEKLIQNPLVISVLTIIKLTCGMKNKLSQFDLRIILSNFLEIPTKYCKEILEHFELNRTLIEYNFTDDDYNKKYQEFLNIINENNQNNKKLSLQAIEIFDKLVELKTFDANVLNKFNFFIKQLQEFENIFKENFDKRKSEIITQIENSIIAENPYSTLEIKPNDLIVGTPQKIIDNQIKTRYQIWLDVSSDEWIKSDTGPLYNAWVFQRGWSKDEFTIDDNITLSKEKTARILRKLTLCTTEHIYAYSSLFDGNGIENFGGIEKLILTETKLTQSEEQSAPKFRIIPRPDQLPVLEYKTGKMAISAVPGAGKTTILLALILKLLDMGAKPENIFVLTYMESAARNFRERIKTVREESSQLPNISTIHGLALRILKENGNFERLGLASDFEICDDTQRSKIIKEIANKMHLQKQDIDDFDRGISVFKMGGGSFGDDILNIRIKKFKTFFEGYQFYLKSLNLIDYDDMLISSVKLLEENQDILNHYQNICHYIIEDEAQDSSAIQQKLINLLSTKHKNLIRCGDINQAITTTFSNADVEGFRNFITESNPVSMDCSQRCTKDVWRFANKLVTIAEQHPDMKNAFFKIFMKPVEGKNPISENALSSHIFENQTDEKNYILTNIKTTLKKNPKATIGILLRNNFQVIQWQEFINNNGFKTITRSECLEQKTIFRVIFAILKMIQYPFSNDVIGNSYETLAECGFYKQNLGAEIRKYENPFISINCDNLQNTYLEQFYWDSNYWLSFPHLKVDELVIKIGLHYFSSEIEKSNIYLIATLVKRLYLANSDFNSIILRLSELSKKPSLSGFKFFSEEDENDKDFLAGKIQIMTLHKSKGDEFDLVFLPEMTEKNLPLEIANIKLKSADFMEGLKQLNPSYKKKNEYQLKQELLAENLRLLYVAITRAKKNLHITMSTKSKSFNKIVSQQPSLIFDITSESEVIYG